MTERSVLVRIRGDVSDLNRALEQAGLRTEALGTKMKETEASGNALFQSITAIAPAIAPIAVQAIPAIAGLTAQFGVAASAAGVALLAFHGVGDALKAVNTYQVTPTTANLVKMQHAMAELGPAGRNLVRELEKVAPVLHELQGTARAGLFPGVTAGIKDVLTLAPQLNRIIAEIATTSGHLASQAGAGLAGPQFRDFFAYVEANAKPLLSELGHSLGNLALGFANLLVAFNPLEREFSAGFLSMARSFSTWAAGLDKTQGFQEFLDYVKTTGPQVLSTLESVGNALVQVGKAIAPLGGPSLFAIRELADAIAALANSPLGTPLLGAVAAINAWKLAMRGLDPIRKQYQALLADQAIVGIGPVARPANSSLAKSALQISNIKGIPANAKLAFGSTSGTLGGFGALSAAELEAKYAAVTRLQSGLVGLAKGGAVVAGVGLAMSGLADKTGLANTATLGLSGAMFGPWGAAAGIALGATRDLTEAQKGLADAIGQAHTAAVSSSLDQKLAAQQALLDEARNLRYGGASQNFSRIGALIHDHLPSFTRPVQGFFGINSGTTELLAAAAQNLNAIKADQAANRLKLLADGFHLTAAGARAAGQSVADFQTQIQQMDNVLSHRAAIRDYRAAIRDFNAALKVDGRTVNSGTVKGDDLQAKLDAIAGVVHGVADGLTQTQQIEVFGRARKGFIEFAERAGMAKKAAEALASRVLSLDYIKGTVHIDADARAARAQLDALDVYLTSITRPRKIGITVGAPGGLAALLGGSAPPPVQHLPKGNHKALGGIMTGPGGPRDDMIDARLSNGEFVVNAFATSRNRDLLEQINSQKYATGGYVTRSHQTWSGPSPSFLGLKIHGTLDTPFGPAKVRGIVQAESHADRNFAAAVGGMHHD